MIQRHAMAIPTHAQLQARPDVCRLSGLLRELLEVGHLPNNLPIEALKVLWYLLDPVNQALTPPANMQQWIRGLQEWRAGVDQLDMPQGLFPFPYKPHVDWMTEVSRISPDLCTEHCQDLLLAVEYAAQPTTDLHSDPYHGLHRWSDPASADVWPSNSLDGAPRDSKMTDFAGEDVPIAHLPHSEVASWAELLPAPLCNASSSIPWWQPTTGVGVVLAGGAVACMVTPGTTPSDFDLFLVVPSKAGSSAKQRQVEARNLIRATINALKGKLAPPAPPADPTRMPARLQFTRNVINIYLPRSESAPSEAPEPARDKVSELKVQIVLRLYESPAQVVHSFDLDASCLLCDGCEVWASTRALRAMHTGTLLADPLHGCHVTADLAAVSARSLSTARLIKYSQRFGMAIIVPGLNEVWREAVFNHLDLVKGSPDGTTEQQVQGLAEALRSESKGVVGLLLRARVPALLDQLRASPRQRDLARVPMLERVQAAIDHGPHDPNDDPDYDDTPTTDDDMIDPDDANDTEETDMGVNNGNDENGVAEEVNATVAQARSPAGLLCAFLSDYAKINRLLGRCRFLASSGACALGGAAGAGGGSDASPVDDWYECALGVLERLNRPSSTPRETAVRMTGIDLR